MSTSTHADAVGLAAHDIPCTNLADSSATTIAELAQGKLAVLGAAQPPARPAPPLPAVWNFCLELLPAPAAAAESAG